METSSALAALGQSPAVACLKNAKNASFCGSVSDAVAALGDRTGLARNPSSVPLLPPLPLLCAVRSPWGADADPAAVSDESKGLEKVTAARKAALSDSVEAYSSARLLLTVPAAGAPGWETEAAFPAATLSRIASSIAVSELAAESTVDVPGCDGCASVASVAPVWRKPSAS